jgi:hypothetical protein
MQRRALGQRDHRDRHEQHRPRAGPQSLHGLVAAPSAINAEEMLARGLSLGGEQSGLSSSGLPVTGDGLCTALNVLRTMLATGRRRELASDLVSIRRCC